MERVFRERATAKTAKGRPQLEKTIDALGANDVFVIAEWDRATRSMMDGITIIQRVADRGAMVKGFGQAMARVYHANGQGNSRISFRFGRGRTSTHNTAGKRG